MNAGTPWSRDMEVMAPASIDEARLFMVHALHEAVFGSSWARPESPAEVWSMLLDKVREASVCTCRIGRSGRGTYRQDNPACPVHNRRKASPSLLTQEQP